MDQTTGGTYRVLESTRDDEEFLLLDVRSGDPTYVAATGYEAPLDERVAALEPGNRVRADLSWGDAPRFADLSVETATRFHFVRTSEPLFEAAKRCWRDAREAGAGMNSRVTYGTDGDPNGVVYTFAAQPGERDLFEEFRDGVKPLDPLLARTAESADPPFSVFVVAHPEHPFVTVYIVLDPEGFLADTVRDTYLSDAVDASSADDAGVGGSLADRL